MRQYRAFRADMVASNHLTTRDPVMATPDTATTTMCSFVASTFRSRRATALRMLRDRTPDQLHCQPRGAPARGSPRDLTNQLFSCLVCHSPSTSPLFRTHCRYRCQRTALRAKVTSCLSVVKPQTLPQSLTKVVIYLIINDKIPCRQKRRCSQTRLLTSLPRPPNRPPTASQPPA